MSDDDFVLSALRRREADVAQLLDVDDMVMMKTPDWKCVFTQVQMYYRRFRMDEMNKQKEEAGES